MRLVTGIALIIGGVLGFLPILGWWMLPLGLLMLSSDYPRVRRLKRKTVLWAGRLIRPKHQLSNQPGPIRMSLRRGHNPLTEFEQTDQASTCGQADAYVVQVQRAKMK